MAKRKHNITLRVYDSIGISKKYADYPDRYALYFPYPKEWAEHGHVADYLTFSFNDEDTIFRAYWNEWNRRYGYPNSLGKKIKIDTLPEFVQKWVKGYEKAWNDFINDPYNDDVVKAWEEYN